ncbi:Citron Rho-interacting kinase [Pleurostoma richardsiae]|uniref:Citron Rho-interacting kinase n=1 Tax=Pleurostoma richardsiae TaxID=41990 RepID=A0AA38VEB3_9PEZI|nr:Citron Rho-interacting kinase [Pleurostoma richardsiae]
MATADELGQGLGLNLDFRAPVMSSLEHHLDHGDDHEQIPATIAPSALMTSAESEVFSIHSLPASGMVEHPTVEAPPPASSSEDDSDESSKSLAELILPETSAPNEYIITLPLPANLRPVYRDILAQSAGSIESFTAALAPESLRSPDERLIQKVDEILQRLTDLCDLPAFLDDIPPMGPEGMMKYSRDTNSKFSFVYELLESLRDADRRVLILAKPGRVMELLDALLSTEAFNYRHSNELEMRQGNPEKPLEVVLASTDRDASEMPDNIDIVIAFDTSARSSGLISRYEALEEVTMILSLVITNSLEHIDLRISTARDSLERKNALLVSVNQARGVISSPEREYLEPHVIAEKFSTWIKDPTADFYWEAQSIPDEIFDAYLNSQAGARASRSVSRQLTGDPTRSTRKRLLMDDDDSGTSTPKRARIAGTEEPSADRVSEHLRHLLANHISLNGRTAEVPLERLEFLAKKMHDLEYRLKQKQSVEDTLRSELRSQVAQKESNIRTVRKFHPKYMEALRDRGTFEVDRDRARQELKTAQAQLDASNSTITNLKDEKKALEDQLGEARAALASSAIPEVAQLAKAEEQLREEEKKVQALEKKLTSQQGDMEYTRKIYQDASSSAASLGVENRELSARVAELEQRASENLLKIHQVDAEGEAAALRRLWEEERAIRQERERDLERAREELRVLKNGRRETRQTSVPRSPRLGVMSPRTSRGAAGSRGTSPASTADAITGAMPNMTFFHPQPQANGSGRWGSHLRE